MILDRVVCSRNILRKFINKINLPSRQKLCYIRPFISIFHMLGEKDSFFLLCPIFFFDVVVEMIVPSIKLIIEVTFLCIVCLFCYCSGTILPIYLPPMSNFLFPIFLLKKLLPRRPNFY